MKHYYEDFQVGDEFITPGRTVTEADVMLFAGLSGDYNPLHTDAEYARETIYGERIAHGLLGLSIATGLKARLGIMQGTIMAFLGLEWRFTGPITFGDTIHCRVRIKSMRETSKPDRGIIVQAVQIVNQRGEVVQEGEMTTMIRRRPSEEKA
ncbi:MAG: MaoC family dehydratase [Herpetosiphonaceae bacterium]|nr:MAG: MaoC family dehydratase [Herpetosiphonaceae bacterium]